MTPFNRLRPARRFLGARFEEMRWPLLALLLSCKARDVSTSSPVVAGADSAQTAVTIPAPVIAPVPPETQPQQPPGGNPAAPSSEWAVSFSLASSFSHISYDWGVGPGYQGWMHAAHQLDSKHPKVRAVNFRASNAALHSLKTKLATDACCAAFRAETCRVPDAPPAEIALSMGELQCTARATPECTSDPRALQCYEHLKNFLRVTCGARCE